MNREKLLKLADFVEGLGAESMVMEDLRRFVGQLGFRSREEQDRLFMVEFWPTRLRTDYLDRRKTRNGTIAEVIRCFVACGGDWNHKNAK
jgi:hypothetical protein